MIEDDVFRITIPLDKVAADEGREQKTLSEREQKIYNMTDRELRAYRWKQRRMRKFRKRVLL